jgi:hypothetical protein
MDFKEVRTNVNFNVGRTNVSGAQTSAAQTSMRTNVDYHLRRCSLLSVAQNSRHQKTTTDSPVGFFGREFFRVNFYYGIF